MDLHRTKMHFLRYNYGVTQTDHTGVTQTATIGVTHTVS